MINLADELAQDYLAECREHVAVIEACLPRLNEVAAGNDERAADQIIQGLRSVEKGADFFGLPEIGELARQMGEVLALILTGVMPASPERTNALVRANDLLRVLIHNLGIGDPGGIAEIKRVLSGMLADYRESASECCAPASIPKRLRMLLVEDDFASRLVLQTFLARYGECHIAVNGREAVEAFGSALELGNRYDLICMDIMMPELDGRQAVNQIRALEENRGIRSTNGAKIIMTTAVDDVSEVFRCFGELCDAYLTKPVDMARLIGHMKLHQLIS